MTSLATLTASPQKVRVAQRVGAGLSTLLEFDASLSESHTQELAVTDHPIETGADITDHIRQQPKRLDMTAIISNAPIEVLASQGIGIKGGSPRQRAEDGFSEIGRWIDEGLILTVITTLRRYENMVCMSANPRRDAANGKVLNISLSFRELFTAETQLVDAPEPAQEQNRKRGDKGRKTKKPAKPENEETINADAANQESGLAKLVNKAFGASRGP